MQHSWGEIITNVVVMVMRQLDGNHTVVSAADGDCNHVHDDNNKQDKGCEDDDRDAYVQEKDSAMTLGIDIFL